jgi:GntR family transcriptional regulator, gluconate operon transcriptional repressor
MEHDLTRHNDAPVDGKLARSIHSRRVVNELREAIVSGRLEAGTPLVETTLAQELGVSRGPIRNAFQELHAQGLVETTRSGRTLVAGFGEKELLDFLLVRFELELIAARRGIAQGASPEAVCLAYAELETARGVSNERLAELDIAFHRALVEYGGSRSLLQAWLALAPVILTVLVVANRRAELDQFELHEYLEGIHTPIVDALVREDADTVRDELRLHFIPKDYYRRASLRVSQPLGKRGAPLS